MKRALFIIALACMPFGLWAAEQIDVYSSDFWEIPGATNKTTWIEIHNSKEAQKSGVAHISVHARKKGDPIWKVEGICPHIAITTEALKRSVSHPYKTRGAYPEHFYEAYDRWKEAEKAGQATICSTTLQDCLSKLQ
jgi:hypothetical protein